MDNAQFYLEDLRTKFNKINPKDYYLSYSGGKDSHLLYWFIKEYAPEFKDIQVVAVNTYMEHPQIRDRMEKHADKILLPQIKPFEIKEKYGIPCFSKEQDFYIYYFQNSIRKGKEPSKTIKDKIMGNYKTGFNISKKAREYVLGDNAHKITHLCCHFLKKEPFRRFEKESGLKPILGVRNGESTMRKRQYTSCFNKNGKFTPLWDLTEKIEDAIYKKYNIELPEIYRYVERTGCMGCPYGSYRHDTEKELNLLDQNQKKFVCEYFKESYQVLGIDTNENQK